MLARVICGVDAGGTTFKCAVADETGAILARRRINTGADPAAAISACCGFFEQETQARQAAITGVGLAAFGPLDLDPASKTYGALLRTTKPGWSHAPLRQAFVDHLKAPVAIDTDVNAALLAEMRFGAAQGAQTAAYFTLGTGIGAGLFARGGLLGGPAHPEFGHIAVRRAPGDELFDSVCPFHADCLEGLASGASLTARFGDLETLADDHPCWDLAADYLAQACRAAFLALRPERIVLGGGVMQRTGLIARVQRAWSASMGGFLSLDLPAAENIAVPAGLGDDAGLIGALLLAQSAAEGVSGVE